MVREQAGEIHKRRGETAWCFYKATERSAGCTRNGRRRFLWFCLKTQEEKKSSRAWQGDGPGQIPEYDGANGKGIYMPTYFGAEPKPLAYEPSTSREDGLLAYSRVSASKFCTPPKIETLGGSSFIMK